jgi:hypothetical protein
MSFRFWPKAYLPTASGYLVVDRTDKSPSSLLSWFLAARALVVDL